MNIPTELIEMIIDEGDYREWRMKMKGLIEEYHLRVHRNSRCKRNIISFSYRYSKAVWDDISKRWMKGISITMNHRNLEWKLSGNEDSQERWDEFYSDIQSPYRHSCKLSPNY